MSPRVVVHCGDCGKPASPGDNFCGGCGCVIETPVPHAPAVVASVQHASPSHGDEGEQTLRRLADYEKVSAILWLCLGVFQVVMVITVIAGVWNIHAAWTRLKLPGLIRARDPDIPAIYEGRTTQLVLIGVVNVVAGGMIGIAFVIFDFIVRDMVLRNRDLFTEEVVEQEDDA